MPGKFSKKQSLVNRGEIFSDTSHEVWVAAQSSYRGCQSQTTHQMSQAQIGSTMHSQIPTPRLPMADGTFEAAENANARYDSHEKQNQNGET